MTLPQSESACGPCGSGCGSCRLGAEWAAAEAALPKGQGRSLLVGSFLFFLLPAALAFLGAWCARADAAVQLLGGLAGLGAGMGLARWIGPRLGPRTPSTPEVGS